MGETTIFKQVSNERKQVLWQLNLDHNCQGHNENKTSHQQKTTQNRQLSSGPYQNIAGSYTCN